MIYFISLLNCSKNFLNIQNDATQNIFPFEICQNVATQNIFPLEICQNVATQNIFPFEICQNVATQNIFPFEICQNADNNLKTEFENKIIEYQKLNHLHFLEYSDSLKHKDNLDILFQQFMIFNNYYNKFNEYLHYYRMYELSNYLISLGINDCKNILEIEKTIYEVLTPLLSFILRNLNNLNNYIFDSNIKATNRYYYISVLDFIIDKLQSCNINISKEMSIKQTPNTFLIKYLEYNENFCTTFKRLNILFLLNCFQDFLLNEIQTTNSTSIHLKLMLENIKAHMLMIHEKENFIEEMISQILGILLKNKNL